MNLVPVSANVPKEFQDRKQDLGVTWVYVIRRGLKAIEKEAE